MRIETREERKERKVSFGVMLFVLQRREKQEQANYKLEQDLALCTLDSNFFNGFCLGNPKKNPKATSNPYNTMFVARLVSHQHAIMTF